MKHTSCPMALVNAPIDIVWRLLTEPSGWERFFDVRIIRVDPPGQAVIGQRIHGESGPRWLHLGITFEFTDIDVVQRTLGMHIRLPLGITVRETLTCRAVSETQCRVNYQCAFEVPAGWRATVAGILLRREFESGPADSLSRLARASEREFAAQK
jgi:hypothetical protein